MRPSAPATRTALVGLLAVIVAACGSASGSTPSTPSTPGPTPSAATTAPTNVPAASLVPSAVSPSPEAWVELSAAPSPTPGVSAEPTPDPLLLAGGELVLDQDLPFDAETERALQRVLEAARKRIPTPGISVAIRTRDGRVWLGTSGARQLGPRRPVTRDTVFSIASITKTFVTAVVLQLVAEGEVSLDDKVAEYVPDFPRARRITIRMLLNHRSGIHNYFESPEYNRAVFANPGRRWTTEEILDFVGKPYCDPGRCYHYSNTNFVLLGLVIEAATAESPARQIRDRLLDPLGLEHTFYQPDERAGANIAHGHLLAGGRSFFDQTEGSKVLPHMSAATVAGPAGAMASNADDLARWAMVLYGSHLVVEPDLLEQMLRFKPRDEYGLGTRTRVFGGRRGFGHGGSLRGYEDQVWYFPREGVSIALLSNRGLYNPDKTVRQLLRELWRHIDVPEPQYDPSKNTN